MSGMESRTRILHLHCSVCCSESAKLDLRFPELSAAGSVLSSKLVMLLLQGGMLPRQGTQALHSLPLLHFTRCSVSDCLLWLSRQGLDGRRLNAAPAAPQTLGSISFALPAPTAGCKDLLGKPVMKKLLLHNCLVTEPWGCAPWMQSLMFPLSSNEALQFLSVPCSSPQTSPTLQTWLGQSQLYHRASHAGAAAASLCLVMALRLLLLLMLLATYT